MVVWTACLPWVFVVNLSYGGIALSCVIAYSLVGMEGIRCAPALGECLGASFAADAS
jgi:hypothetical protein